MHSTNTNLEFIAKTGKLWIFPVVLYWGIFCVLTYPLILQFNTHFFADAGDGLQNVWNIWWINKAVTELNQNPWYTTYLHYPAGTSLIGQTLNPFNGFMGVIFLKFLSLIQTHNVIVLFAFVMSGFTAFWLSYSITQSYWSSLVAGYVFTFSEYHFMHAEGHMQLISQEWVPLFVLCWYLFITKPNFLKAIISGIVLLGVILCDYYYFFYCVLAGVLITLWYGVVKKDLLFFLKRQYIFLVGTFIFVSLITSGILIISLIQTNAKDPLIGSHEPFEYSLDLLAPFIPGGHWRFAQLTQFYWSKLPGNINESSVYLGLSVVFLICYAWFKRAELRSRFTSFYLWFGIILFFGIMALGPGLHIGGKLVYSGMMPYSILQTLFPPINLSGVPVRMMVMVTLGASVICAMGLSWLFQRLAHKRLILGGVLCFFLFFEFLPKPIPTTRIRIPEYITYIEKLPDNGSLFDTITGPPVALYFQTIHEKPLADGYVSRMPTSVFAQLDKKMQALQNQDYQALIEDHKIRYLLVPTEIPNIAGQPKLDLLYNGQDAKLYVIEGFASTP